MFGNVACFEDERSPKCIGDDGPTGVELPLRSWKIQYPLTVGRPNAVRIDGCAHLVCR